MVVECFDDCFEEGFVADDENSLDVDENISKHYKISSLEDKLIY